ncbi:glycosyltransferase family 4 protein [Pseudomonas grimontii]|jgi:glycosyltransferase involved in cell wall biosynthesis|uniref:glycosyltransferase family 4 protein n=1 Tax=Pseudomonas grimontii TaxID=129847 RepID=UPI00387AB5E8
MDSYFSSDEVEVLAKEMRQPVVAIDASRSRSGGAKAHLVGILSAADPLRSGIAAVHVWSYKELLDKLPDEPWLIKHNPLALEQTLAHQLFWQLFKLPAEIKVAGCDVLLTTDAGSICPYRPAVSMSRDMLSFEPGEMERYGFSIARLRLLLLRYVQVSSLKRATGALFLTKYASNVIQKFTGRLFNVRVIPHGISEQFRRDPVNRLDSQGDHVRCVYISNADMYKHQWHVIRAIRTIRDSGVSISLHLVGGGSGPAKSLLNAALRECDPRGEFVELVDAVRHSEIPAYLAGADIFVFASSCENMPNTLVEAMASGLPIACSDRGPMPEILKDAGVYFDPENHESISIALFELLRSHELRKKLAERAYQLSTQYSWARCARETWSYLSDTWAAHQSERK